MANKSWWRIRRHFVRRSFVKGLSRHYWVLGAVTVAVPITVATLVGWGWHSPVLGVSLAILLLALVLAEGAFQLERESRSKTSKARKRVEELEASPVPRLSF